jgi:hypothetical protein
MGAVQKSQTTSENTSHYLGSNVAPMGLSWLGRRNDGYYGLIERHQKVKIY